MYARTALHAVPRLKFLRAFAAMRKRIRREYPIVDFTDRQASLLAEILKIEPSEASDLIDDWINHGLDDVYRRLTPLPHLNGCLRVLRGAGLRLCVLSDFPIESKLRYLGLQKGWDCVISSQESGYLKPRREPFHSLADRLDVSPEDIVYVGNNYEYDVVGASRAGLKTAHLTRRRRRDNVADIVFSDYRRLAPAIFELGRS